MGFDPQTVRRLSIWQYMAAVDGWNAAHETEETKNKLSDDEAAALYATLDTPPVWEQ